MVTPIKNKVSEMAAYVARVHAEDGEVGVIDLRAYARRRWPDLDPLIREQIVQSYRDTL